MTILTIRVGRLSGRLNVSPQASPADAQFACGLEFVSVANREDVMDIGIAYFCQRQEIVAASDEHKISVFESVNRFQTSILESMKLFRVTVCCGTGIACQTLIRPHFSTSPEDE